MKMLLTLVFAAMFYSAGFSQQVQLLGEDSGAGQSAEPAKTGLPAGEKAQVIDLSALEASLSEKPAVKAVATGVKGIKESSSTAKNVQSAGKKKAAAKTAKNTAKIIVSTSVPAGAAAKTADGAKPAAEQKQGFAVNKSHLVIKGETLWGLSGKYYKDPFKWGKIYNANINSVSNPDLIYPENELEIPDITEEVKPLVSQVGAAVPPATTSSAGKLPASAVWRAPAAQKEPVIGEDETIKEPELESSEILTAPEASAPAAASSADKLSAGPVVAKAAALPQPGEKPEEVFKSDDLSEEMPADQKEWSSGVKIVNGNWREDGVITSKSASDEDVADGLSVSGETVLVRLRSEGLVKKGDYLETYMKGTSAYDKKGRRRGFELQRAGRLEVLSVDGNRVRAKVLDASTAINKGLIVKKK